MLVQEVVLEGVPGHVEHPPAEEAGVALPAVVLHHAPHELVHLAEQRRVLWLRGQGSSVAKDLFLVN